MYKYFLDIFPLFTIPFNIGLLFFLTVMLIKFSRWTRELNVTDRWKFVNGFRPKNLWGFIKETVSESLLHLRIFKTNFLLGYMHTSLAFGWFLLIVVGNIEAKLVRGGAGTGVELPHFPIFLKYFETAGRGSLVKTVINSSIQKGTLDFLMDLLLLIILSGCVLAYSKRFRSKTFGMKNTTKLKIGDKITMYSLWFIFPARLIAESITAAAYGTGSFLTGSLGSVFASFIPQDHLLGAVAPFWWLYSITLGAFFGGVPFSRYMHILSEPILIFMRHAGIKSQPSIASGFSQAEIFSCSRCGICINTCQLANAADIKNIQPSYFIRNLRHHDNHINMIDNCLICGRCNNACPVNIDIENLRLTTRKEIRIKNKAGITYLPAATKPTTKTEVLYFAGCMSHLTPSIKNSMITILETSGENYQFMDKDGAICCGRPLKLSGQVEAAQQVISANKERILNSGAKILVTSCPICYRVFKEDYQLNIEVLHHTEYLLRLIDEKKISVSINKNETVAYHDPCDLGRGSGIYEAPRQLIQKMTSLENTTYQKENALCCGGSLGNSQISVKQRQLIATDALQKINPNKLKLITACPLCKKTFENTREVEVIDIVQLVVKNLKTKETINENKANSKTEVHEYSTAD